MQGKQFVPITLICNRVFVFKPVFKDESKHPVQKESSFNIRTAWKKVFFQIFFGNFYE